MLTLSLAQQMQHILAFIIIRVLKATKVLVVVLGYLGCLVERYQSYFHLLLFKTNSEKGTTGLIGFIGDPGLPGRKGIPGEQGEKGASGSAGMKGTKGSLGDKVCIS